MWVVIKTKPNQEVRAKYNLNNQGFNTYLPILRQKKFYRGKWIDYNEIMFKGYIFVKKDCAFNIQLRFKNGLPMIFEINPRFSSTVYARHILGFPDLAIWVGHTMNLNCNFKFNFKKGMKFSRYFSYKIKN